MIVGLGRRIRDERACCASERRGLAFRSSEPMQIPGEHDGPPVIPVLEDGYRRCPEQAG